MQKTKGNIKGTVIIKDGKKEILKRVIDHLKESRSVKSGRTKIGAYRITGLANQNKLQFDISYEAAGAWPSDLNAKISNALVKCGSKAAFEIKDVQRTVVAVRAGV